MSHDDKLEMPPPKTREELSSMAFEHAAAVVRDYNAQPRICK